MKKLDKCCNGCDVPPAPPSKVLCKECLDNLSEKFERVAAILEKGESND